MPADDPDRELPGAVGEEAEQLQIDEPGSTGPGSSEARLLHELSVYQFELAAQREELRQTQEALDESRERFRELYADAPVGFFTIGIQGRILDCNSRGAALLRLSVVTASRRRITEFMTAEGATMFLRRVNNLYHTKVPVSFECEIRRADGKGFWAEIAMNLTAEKSETAATCQLAMSDITDRKRLRDDTARLVAIVESSDQAILSQDLEGTITSWNAGAERLFGYSGAEVIGHSISLIVSHDRADEERDVRARVARGDGVALETIRSRRDGSTVPVFISAAPILSQNGHVAGISSIMRDISEQITGRHEVARLLDDLRRTDRQKDDFIATLAHELRNPLAPIRNAVAVMRFMPDLGPKLQWCRDVIDRQVGHMASLLDDLLDISRLTRDKITLRRDRVELGAAIAQAVEINRPLLESRHHILTLTLGPHPVEVEGDLTRLVQIFGNLLNNAAKYTEPGGEIEVAMAIAVDQAVIRVRDNGIGIRRENLASIFDLFAQVDPKGEGVDGGLGIGLALVKGLVERHGGNISARSRGLGHGSEFIVCLPMVRSASVRNAGDDAIRTAEAHGENKLNVLVVDDNVDAAESLALILQADHHAVRTAHNGEDALRMAVEQNPDVMVLDLGMPKMSGYEVARRVRKKSWGRRPVLIACSGWGQPEDRRRSQESGFDHHLVKPVNAAVLLRLVRTEAEPGQ